MSKRVFLNRLALLSNDDLGAVVAAVECAIVVGDGWLQRQEDGSLRVRDASSIVITEANA